MRGEPKSRSRQSSQSSRWWESRRSICALAFVALAPACSTSTPAAGVRPETGGQGGQGGQGGSANGNGGTSGGATGSGGSGLGTGGAFTDAGLGPFDGGACTDDASQQTDPNMTPASGTFSGALAGAVCTGATFAHVQSTPADDGGAPRVELLIASVGAGDPAARIRFQNGANVTDGELSVDVGISAATPGTYTQVASCGAVVLIGDLPAPDPSICATDAQVFGCVTGCESTGPDQPCTPIPPQVIYAAVAASDCHGYPTTGGGSWTVTLTSLTAEPDAGTGTVGSLIYKAHGTLSATLAGQAADAGTTGVSLTLSF
jgi:hypothetical protein